MATTPQHASTSDAHTPATVVARESSGLALAAFVLGIVGAGIVFIYSSSFQQGAAFLYIFLIVPGVALLSGLLAKLSGNPATGRASELATAGIVLAAVTVLVAVLLYFELDEETFGF